jgi:hypothetical protein
MYNSDYPKNYLVEAILVTLFCCLPFGIVAIVYAAQVNTKIEAGDREGAMKASQNAAKWCAISFWSTVIFIILYLVLTVIAASP